MKNQTKTLAQFTNDEDGVTSFVTEYHKGGYVVSLRDDDSGSFVPFGTIYPSLEVAIEKAKSII